MNKALEAIKDYAGKLQYSMLAWQSPELRKGLEDHAKFVEKYIDSTQLTMHDLLNYIAARITKPAKELLEEEDKYPTINFLEHEQ